MKKSEGPKASKCEDGVDLISDMPDSILLLILSGLRLTQEVIRTSILSRRWRYLWTSIPSLDIFYRQDKLKEDEFKEFVYWVLGNRSLDLDRFRLSCYYHYTMSTLGRWIHMAVTRNVKKLDLTFCPKKESEDTKDIEMPHCLVTCRSLKVLKLCLLEHGLRLPNFIGFPALRVLQLCYVVLSEKDLEKEFLESCPLLEDLRLVDCIINKPGLLCISCPKLKKLRIDNEEKKGSCGGIKISCPKLVFMELTGPYHFLFESLDSLEEVVIETERLPPAPTAEMIINAIRVLIPGISHVKSLWINLSFFFQCINAARDPSLPNLKTLELTTTISAFTIVELIQVLKYYPKLVSLKLFIKQDFCGPEYRELDETETRRIVAPVVKWVELFEYKGEKPKVDIQWYRNAWMEMFARWGQETKFSHW
ncbi:unnamed protein product [Lactuca virosa]|uniref:F-box domain-containing protein n=1 Tax=Lactuca virosa TaxID=75947 RepID=A0AAU9MJ99_9ASTR|nr:unnamed protein product [Lactuca virosa]